MSLDCPCEFGPRLELGAFSREWHRQHRDHHLATFPDVDQGTRDNLASFIVQAMSARSDSIARGVTNLTAGEVALAHDGIVRETQ